MAVIINDPNAARHALEEGAQRLQRAAQFFQDQLISRLSVSNPRPYANSSKPGEYPRKRTGRGIASIIWGPVDIGAIINEGMKTRIGAAPIADKSNYLLILEFFKQRSGFLKTLQDLKPLLQAKLTGKASTK